MVQSTSSCTSLHSIEHGLTATYPDLPHGAGLLMLSKPYFTFFSRYVPDRFIKMAHILGVSTDGLSDAEKPMAFVDAMMDLQQKCGVADLKMSDYGVESDKMEQIARNAHKTMSNLFAMDRYSLSLKETVDILSAAYK